jgi:hypothetical protein
VELLQQFCPIACRKSGETTAVECNFLVLIGMIGNKTANVCQFLCQIHCILSAYLVLIAVDAAMLTALHGQEEGIDQATFWHFVSKVFVVKT